MNAFALAPLFLGMTGAAQHETPPADAMGQLAFMTGKWKGKQTFLIGDGKTMVGDATDDAEFAVGKRFIEERLSTTLPGRSATDTRHMLGFDKKTGKYVAYWFNDTSSLPMVLTGNLDGQKLTLSTASTATPSPTARTLRFTYDGSTPNELTLSFEMQTAGTWQLLFKSVYSKDARSNPKAVD